MHQLLVLYLYSSRVMGPVLCTLGVVQYKDEYDDIRWGRADQPPLRQDVLISHLPVQVQLI